ncbi:GDP-mannose pyrophosphatase NudK [Leptobacterium sp. I13]|uniref:GDP-mannose pyrophosphatase NudK n=1 Tax=Leptobacterium meishanense TaxID=3128904 RepID=UPI0030EDD32F
MNNRVNINEIKVLSDDWYILKKVNFDYQLEDSSWQNQTREVYDRGNGAAILLYNKKQETVILTKQFRMPTYLNKNHSGMMLEVCAGLLDEDNPEDCIIREAEEETGYRIPHVKKVFEAYMSPGAVTEKLYYFVAEYNENMKVSEGGGNQDEHENIEVMEIPFKNALKMIETGEIQDAKSILLLQYAQVHKLI